jgi:hypothetical protein
LGALLKKVRRFTSKSFKKEHKAGALIFFKTNLALRRIFRQLFNPPPQLCFHRAKGVGSSTQYAAARPLGLLGKES